MTANRFIYFLAVALSLLIGCSSSSKHDAGREKILRLATTTSTRDSGLLDLLIPPFEQKNNVRVDVIAVGTGKALKLGETGDVEVVLVHARQAEDAFMEAGFGSRREDVMVNHFELLGPPDDPAGIQDLPFDKALQKIADGNFRFVSRGDDSGTHKRELQLWDKSGGRPDWDDYIETGQGMGATLVMADQKLAYVLADRGTYLSFTSKIDLKPLAAQTDELANPYGILVVKSDELTKTQSELAHKLVDYMISPATQTKIQEFKLSGESLFLPLQPTLSPATIN